MEATLYKITLWSFFAGMIAHFFAFFPKPETGTARKLSLAGTIFILIGFASLTTTIASRWTAQGRLPVSSSYEYLSVLAWFVAVFYFIVMYRLQNSSFLGACISPGLFLAVVFAGLYPQSLEMTLIPALQSYWLKIHVTMTIIGEAAFALAFVMGLLYLVKNCRWEKVGSGLKRKSVLLFLVAMGAGFVAAVIIRAAQVALTGLSGPKLWLSLLGGAFLVAVPAYLFAWRKWLSGSRTGFGGLVFALSILSLMVSGMLLGSWVNKNRSRMEAIISKIRAVDQLNHELDSEEAKLTEEIWERFIAGQKERLALFNSLEALQEQKKRALTLDDAGPLITGSPLAYELSFPLSLGEIREERYTLQKNIAELEELVSQLGLPASSVTLRALRNLLINSYNQLFTTDLLPSDQGRESAFIGYMVLLAIPFFGLFYFLARRVQDRIPALEVLDSFAYRTVSLGFPIFTFGALIAGAIWAHYAWGKWWSNDPKEIGSLIVWLIFLIYLHARYVKIWSGNQAAVAAILGFLFAVLSFVGNSVLGGLHSYG
ncbi:MAG TPA: cytochrome c biogenesis protein CcsA [archaeon]|nr:cytochrome c biogenesis protein CcsA [archaeon]